MTEAEQLLWSRLRRKQLLGVQFYRQKPVGGYILDFYAPSVKLVVEVDGSQHSGGESAVRDQRRDAWLAGQGLMVLRFDNLQVLRETDGVMQAIYDAVSARRSADDLPREIPPSPPFSKGGISRTASADTISSLLGQSEAALNAVLGFDPREARLEAQVLLGHALGQSRAYLIAHATDTPTPAQAEQFQALLKRRLAGEPVAYILGEREFFSLTLQVTPAVLIPRPETELLVELALARLPESSPCRVLDLGTGSGAVAIAIARHRPLAQVAAVDQSAAALEVARQNAARLGAANVRFLLGDWYGPLGGERFDLIVSNPPYIAAADPHLAQGDLRFEPAAALASGADGLDAIRVIVAGARARLNPGGWLLFEHGYDQAAACRELLARAGFREVGSEADLAGIPRVTFGRN